MPSYRKEDTGCPDAALTRSDGGEDVKRLCTAEEHAKWRGTAFCALCAAFREEETR